MRPDTPVLGFDTSAAHCAAGLFLAGRAPVARFEAMERGQAERLIPLLEELLAAEGLGWRDLGAIGVGTGPGNFTGIRIAVSAARGLALGLGIPAVGVSSFDLLADGRGGGPLLLSLPAPRGQSYVQRHDARGPVGAPDLLGEADSPAVSAGCQVVGHDAACIAARVGSALPPVDAAAVSADIGARIAAIAARRLQAATSPLPRPAPLYVRPTEAAPMRDAAPVILP